jgi:hypothetical protein
MSHYLGKEIVTHPHEDEQGNREWRTEHCSKACIRGNREAHILEVCQFYVQKLTQAFCCQGEEWE